MIIINRIPGLVFIQKNILRNTGNPVSCFGGWIEQADPTKGAGTNYYILFGHSLHSTLQAPSCLHEAMSSQYTPYPGAPFLLY